MARLAGSKLSALRLFSPATILTRQGRARRRFNCGDQASWDERAETAVALWTAHESEWRPQVETPLTVADFGAGNERLRHLLAGTLEIPHEYLPYDLHPQLPTSAPLDVSRELPDRDFDLVFCLGLLEYLAALPAFLAGLHACSRFVLVSYVPCDGPTAAPHSERVRCGWVTHLSREELETQFSAAGFTSVGATTCDRGATGLWLWVAHAFKNKLADANGF